jgi:hypothetical protein
MILLKGFRRRGRSWYGENGKIVGQARLEEAGAQVRGYVTVGSRPEENAN